MANTDVRITQQGDVSVPDVFTVPIIAGDTVTFHGDPDNQTSLCMTPATSAILSRQPDLPAPPPDLPSPQPDLPSPQPDLPSPPPNQGLMNATLARRMHPLTVTLAAGGNMALTFLPAAPGNYCIVTQPADWPYPANITCGPGSADSATLSIMVGQQLVFSGPDPIPQT
jgi:hypothetical protein